ncbi:TonB-dependent receptor, partial [Acidobacteria bacterium AH-259-L09]|nr:TonB-dependent receptor [Acidobacteria bacterium AH-259-L09]
MFRFWMVSIAILMLCIPVFSESISGRVTDPSGKPVSGVRLFLLQEEKSLAGSLTNESGHYSFKDLAPGTYIVWVRELGFQQERIEVPLESGQALQRDIILELELLEEQVIVTATRTETPTSLLGNSVTIITAEEMEAQKATNVAEALRNVPGINILQIGGRGSLTTIFVRGGESDYTKVLLDGIPLNQPGGSIDLSNLSTANVERIEVVRGPQSALYGSDAITGVIQIFTKKGSAETAVPALDFFLEGGTFDTFRGGAAVSGAFERLSYSVEFQHLSTDNMDPNDFFHNNSFSANIGIKTSGNSSLTFVGRSERGRSGVPGPTAFGPPDLEEFYRKRDFLAGITWNQRLSDAWQHRMSYSQSYVNQLSVDPVDSGTFFPEFEGKKAPFPSFDFPFSFLSATRRHNVNYQSDFFLSTHLLSTGFDYEEERGVVGEVRADRTNFGYYVQDQFLLLQRLAIAGGLRLEDNGSFGFAATPRVSMAYLLRSGGSDEFWGMTRPKFNFGLGIKEPTFIESFSPNFFFKGNPELEPERTRSFEVGLEQTMAWNRLQMEVNFFHNHFKDQIAFQTVDFQTFEGSFFNIGESRAWGVEHVVKARPVENLQLLGGYTYLNTKVLQSSNPFSPVFQEGSRLLLRPTHSGFLGFLWKSSRWTFNTNATFIGNRADSDFRGIGLAEVDGYTKWDLSGSYQISPQVELYVILENILNQEYFEEIG